VPHTNIASGITDQWLPSEPTGPTRSPEQIRAMLSTYRSGLERGRRMAAGGKSNGFGDGSGFANGRPDLTGPQSFDDFDGMGER